MKHWSVALVVLLAVIVVMAACTQNQRAKDFGGTVTVTLPPGQKLVVATWKEEHLWYLTRPMRPGETPEVLTFHEDSSFGILQGTVVFIERAK